MCSWKEIHETNTLWDGGLHTSVGQTFALRTTKGIAMNFGAGGGGSALTFHRPEVTGSVHLLQHKKLCIFTECIYVLNVFLITTIVSLNINRPILFKHELFS